MGFGFKFNEGRAQGWNMVLANQVIDKEKASKDNKSVSNLIHLDMAQ